MLRSLTLAAAFVLLIGFPAEIFNKTFEKNKDTIHRWFRWLPTHRIADLRIPAAAQLAVFAVIAAALTRSSTQGQAGRQTADSLCSHGSANPELARNYRKFRSRSQGWHPARWSPGPWAPPNLPDGRVR